MDHYFVCDKPQANGDHEVHKEDCTFCPGISNRTYLGFYENCKDAIVEALKKYSLVNGCSKCSIDCHAKGS